jgi:hypothetical protein
LATKKNATNQMNSFTQKIYRNFCTDAIYFPFVARKETDEQHKTKIGIDEFRSGTTDITLLTWRNQLGYPAHTGLTWRNLPGLPSPTRINLEEP